jgi:hypothetical protein
MLTKSEAHGGDGDTLAARGLRHCCDGVGGIGGTSEETRCYLVEVLLLKRREGSRENVGTPRSFFDYPKRFFTI